MQYKITNEQPFQVLCSSFSISPSQQNYTLNISADGVNYSPLFTVASGQTRLVTGVASGSFYKLVGNQSQVTVNWVRSCNSSGSGGGGNAGELEPVSEFPLDAPEGTVVALASGDTVGVYQYDGSEWIPVAGGDMSNYYTKAQTNAAISAATSPIQSQVDDIERVTATALTELHDSILELSGATQGYATEAYVDAAITSATQDFVTEEDLTGYTSMQDFEDFQDAISVKEEVVAAALVDLDGKKVESEDIHYMVSISQADYDALVSGGTVDSGTFYIITGSTSN